MGHVLLTGILVLLAGILTMKGFKDRSMVRKTVQIGVLCLGIFLIGMAVAGIVFVGEGIRQY
ncbi:hypothetical protein EQV77_13190 [Halobacillus fulvus]|nr:hypothetical protein EQV77_13190 [Halobacillus fulvus]